LHLLRRAAIITANQTSPPSQILQEQKDAVNERTCDVVKCAHMSQMLATSASVLRACSSCVASIIGCITSSAPPSCSRRSRSHCSTWLRLYLRQSQPTSFHRPQPLRSAADSDPCRTRTKVGGGPRHCTTAGPPSLTCETCCMALNTLVLTKHETLLNDWLTHVQNYFASIFHRPLQRCRP